MQLRIISPSESTDAVLAALDDEAGATDVVVLHGAARRPVGDLVTADIARESADSIIDRLRGLGIQHAGSITVLEVEVAVSDAIDRAERDAPGFGDDAVVWQSVEQRTGQETQVSLVFIALMAVATMIAGVGVILDQPILIVGAMAVGPDFGPLAAASVGIVRRRPRVVATSVFALTVGYGVGILTTIGSTTLLHLAGLADQSMIVGAHRSLDFIWTPNALSWTVGFLAGIAGVLSLTSTRSGALVGVAISVTTIPAAANAAAALALGATGEIAGSLLQLVVNLLSIILGGVITLAILRLGRRLRRPHERTVSERRRWRQERHGH